MADLIYVFVPFIFAFAIAYGALETSRIFSKRVAGVLSMALAFFAVSSSQVVEIIYAYLPYATVVFIAVFFISFILSPFKSEDKKKDFTMILAILGLLVVFMINIGYDVFLNAFPSYAVDLENFMYAGGLILIAMLLFVAYQRGKT